MVTRGDGFARPKRGRRTFHVVSLLHLGPLVLVFDGLRIKKKARPGRASSCRGVAAQSVSSLIEPLKLLSEIDGPPAPVLNRSSFSGV